MFQNQPAIKITTSLASVAAASTTTSTVINLGPNWSVCTALALKRSGVASAGEILWIEYSENNSTWYTAVGGQPAGQASNSTSAADMSIDARVTGRYVRVKFLNGATPQSATASLQLIVQPDFF
jgi:hypothetical protein